MMRILKMFSSSQAQPVVKDEAGSHDAQESESRLEDQYEVGSATQPEERHDQELLDVGGSDVSVVDAEVATTNGVKGNNRKEKTNGKAKRGKATRKASGMKTARKSQVQEQLLQELGEEPGEMEVEMADTAFVMGMDGSPEAVDTVNGSKKGKRKSKHSATESTKKASRKSARAVEAADIEDESDYGVSHHPKRRSRSTNGGPALEEAIAGSVASQTLQSRKSNGASHTESGQKNAPLSEVPENGVVDEDSDSEAVLDLINKARLERTKPDTVPKKPRKSRAKKHAATEIAPDEHQKDVTSQGLANLPEKVARAKRKAKTSKKPILDELVLEDRYGSTSPLQQPLSPVPVHHRGGLSAHDDHLELEAQLQSNAWSSALNAATPSIDPDEEEGVDTTPKQPSRKALGKRKASDTILEPRKKQRKKNEKSTSTPPLTNFGFTSHSDAAEAEQLALQQSFDQVADLGTIAAKLFKQAVQKDRSPMLQQQATSRIVANERRPTPAFTPINRRKVFPEAEERTPTLPSSRPIVLLSARPPVSLVRTPPEVALEAPSDAPHAATPEVSVQDQESDAGSDFQLNVEPDLPKSNERRKRRLPTGEPESSTKQSKTSKSRALSKVPKAKASSKTPTAGSTPRAPRTAPVSKKGRISDDQIVEIAQHVESWRDQNDMTQHALNEMVQKSLAGETKSLVNYVCDEMSDIPRIKIINILRRKYHNYEARGAWTQDQDRELKNLYESYPGKWKQIGEIMNRFAEDCRDRWRNYLVCGDKQRKDVWSKEEEESLKVAVAGVLKSIRELKRVSNDPMEASRDEDSLIDWKTVSENMGQTRSRLQCLTKWERLKEREETIPDDPVAIAPIAETEWRLEEALTQARIMSADEKLRLLHAIRDSGAGREGKIPWVSIQRNELKSKKGKRMALKVCFRTLRDQVSDHEDMQFTEIVQYLINAFEAAAPNEPDGFQMKFVAPTPSKKRRKRLKADTDEEDGYSSAKKKKRRSSPLKAGDLDGLFVEDESMDNGEGPSTRRLSIAKAKRPSLIQDSGSSKKKKKVRERMRQQGQSPSQDTSATSQQQGEDEDILVTMQSMKNGKAKAKRVAKKPLKATKTTRSKPLSAERVTTSDDELEPVPEEGEGPILDNTEPEDARAEVRREPDEDSEAEEEPHPELDPNIPGVDHNLEDESLPDAEPAAVHVNPDPVPKNDEEPMHSSQHEVTYPDLDHDLEDSDKSEELSATSFETNQASIPINTGRTNGVESDADEEDESPPDLVDPDREDSYTLPAHPRTQPAKSQSSTSSDSEDSEEENEYTTMTHDQESVDLDNSNDDDIGNAIEDYPENANEHESEPEAEPTMNGFHHEDEEIQNAYLDIPFQNQEQRGFDPASQRLQTPVALNGYEAHMDQYHHVGLEDDEQTPGPGRNGFVRAPSEISSDASSIPRYVSSTNRRAQSDDEDSDSDSDEDSDEETEEELVERYADDDVDDDYEETQPRRRAARRSGRTASLEL
ncbi:hypothetical protein EG329_011687 [Mollisiaceae sp. DMI_Dod_QoI]|nr:hypothetical protein EG329_011687 [Helotiales sp. DMI_Dod_QoI]